MTNIKLQKYADIKKSSIEDVIKYASGKGVAIPVDPEFVLDDTILKKIDPIFQFKLKYNKVVRVKPNESEHIGSDSFNQSVCPKTHGIFTPSGEDNHVFKSVGKIGLDELEKSMGLDKTDEKTFTAYSTQEDRKKTKKKSKKRVIGIVKFYDWNKDFGFVVTGNKGVSNKPEDSGKLYDFYINSSEWNSSSSPDGGDWIVFTPKKKSSWMECG